MRHRARYVRALKIAVAVGGVALVASLVVIDPATSLWFPPCLWRMATGWLCPGCGSARAMHALLNGDIAAAIRFNPLVLMCVAHVVVCEPIARTQGPVSLRRFGGARGGWAWAMTIAVFAVGRNLPVFVLLVPPS